MPRSSSPCDKERKSRALSKKSKRDRRRRSSSSDSSSSSSATDSSSGKHRNRSSSRSSRKRSSSTKEERRKRKRSTSSSSSPSPSRKKKLKKEKKAKRKRKKEKKKAKKKEKEKQRKKSTDDKGSEKVQPETLTRPKTTTGSAKAVGPAPRVMKPMTKEEWEKQQSVMRHVYDEESGRTRLIKGDGEVMEEIVSKERHKEINKISTQGDGRFYASKMGLR